MKRHSPLQVLLLTWILCLSPEDVNAFQSFSTTCRRGPFLLHSISNIKDPPTKSKAKKDEEEGITETDARVLKSMLQDTEKLDLKTEENMKKLLERGVVSKEVPQVPGEKEKVDSEFSSQVVQTLSDTKLWQAFSRKAGDFFESAKLYVQNRVERDAMTLAALGLFAWERAVRDVGRALPAAGGSSSGKERKEEKQKSLLLSEKSSFEDMATPMDELKSVGSAVAEILKSGGEASTATAASGVLRTAATSRQDKRNFQRSYDRQQERRDVNRNPVKVTQKAASGVADTAWQLKRELESEVNAPGYKTKQVQTALEAAQDSTRQLLQGAKETWRLEREKTKQMLQPVEEETLEEMVNAEAEAVAEFIDIQHEIVEEVIDTQAQPETTVQQPQVQDEYQRQYEAQQQYDDVEQQRQKEAERRQQQIEAEQKLQQEWQQQQKLTRDQEQWHQLQSELQVECFRLKDQLQNCIVYPEQTWLRADIVQGVQQFDQSLIKVVVTEMIATRNSLKQLIKEQAKDSWKMEQTLEELVSIRNQVEELRGHAREAVSPGASEALKELLLEQADATQPVLSRLEELQSQLEELVQHDVSTQFFDESTTTTNPDFFYAANPQETVFTEPDVVEEQQQYEVVSATVETITYAETDTDTMAEKELEALEADIVDVIPEAFVYAVATTPLETGKATAPASAVELVTDDDFEAAVGETKQAVAVEKDQDSEEAVGSTEETQDNVLITLLLRALDIVFLLLEKTFTVALPTLLTSGGTAKERWDDVSRGGLGSEGWKRIGNAKEGSKRY